MHWLDLGDRVALILIIPINKLNNFPDASRGVDSLSMGTQLAAGNRPGALAWDFGWWRKKGSDRSSPIWPLVGLVFGWCSCTLRGQSATTRP